MPISRLLLVTVFYLLGTDCRAEEADYSKSVNLPPLRISIAELQGVLNKAASLMASANSEMTQESRSEEIVKLRAGDLRVTFPGHELIASRVRFPKTIDGFDYINQNRLWAPVSRVEMAFSDYDRTLRVNGTSPEQVDAVFSALRDDLMKLSTPIGGSSIKIWFGLAPFIIGILTFYLGIFWLKSRSRRQSLPFLISAVCLLGLVVLPLDHLLAGFLMVEGDGSFMVRYGPEISFWGLAIGVAAIPLSYLLSAPLNATGQDKLPLTPRTSSRSKRRRDG